MPRPSAGPRWRWRRRPSSRSEAEIRRGGESVSRIQAALRNSGYRWPGPKTTINLAPADVKKESAAYDLPIALAVMTAAGQFVSEKVDDYLVVGELALDGRVRQIKGALATAMLAAQQERTGVIVPADPPRRTAEAAVVAEIDAIPVRFLSDAVGFLTDELPIEPTVVDLDEVFRVASKYDVDFADVRGRAGRGPAEIRPRRKSAKLERSASALGPRADRGGGGAPQHPDDPPAGFWQDRVHWLIS